MELVFLRRRMYISFHSFYCLFIAVNDMAKIERRPKKRREKKNAHKHGADLTENVQTNHFENPEIIFMQC